MAKRNIKLKWTLLITYLIIGLCPLIILSNLTFESVEKYFIEERKKELLLQANVISGHISISDYMHDESKSILFDYDINQTSKQSGYRIMVLDNTGVVIKQKKEKYIIFRKSLMHLIIKMFRPCSQTILSMLQCRLWTTAPTV